MKPQMLWIEIEGRRKPVLYVRDARRGRAWVVYYTKRGVQAAMISRDRISTAQVLGEENVTDAICKMTKLGANHGMTVRARDLLVEALTRL